MRFWNIGRASKNLVRTALILWFFPAARDDEVAIDTLEELRPLFEGKTVALVGNAQSLFGSGLGQEIESCAVVARMNFGAVRSPVDQGTRTDILFFATKVGRSEARRLFGCNRFVWASPRRSMIALGFLLHPRSIAFVPFQDADHLADRLRARPSIGIIALHLLLNRLGAGEVRLYGFDWKETRTFYEEDIFKNVHAWESERDLIRKWGEESHGRLVIRSQGGTT